MLSFEVYESNKLAESANLAGSYVVGSDDVPLRAEVTFRGGVIQCTKRAAGPAGLALLWKIDGVGEVLTETVRLLERDTPYNLHIELARGRLLRLNQKIEDWGLLDQQEPEDAFKLIHDARELLIQALQADTPAQAAVFADKSLAASVQGSEGLSAYHANAFFDRRLRTGSLPRRVLGCRVADELPPDQARERISAICDFVTVPMNWCQIEPTEQTYDWKVIDGWIEILAKQKIPIKGSPLLCFHENIIPQWLYAWENDFDTLRDLAFEHIRRVVHRYGQYVHSWDVVSAVHAPNCMPFNFEQIMELTRMAAALTKQTAPKASIVLDITMPWGEYYSRNQRTIPPLLYADMAVQSGVAFDAFGLQFNFGPQHDGMFVRDMFQISSLLDAFGKIGKPIQITGMQVPSGTGPDGTTANSDDRPDLAGGTWRGDWNEQIQAEWMKEFAVLALSKPFVESVSWSSFYDYGNQPVPHGGLLRSDAAPKQAYHDMADFYSKIKKVN